jgi:cellulase/cellobiase CelA1
MHQEPRLFLLEVDPHPPNHRNTSTPIFFMIFSLLALISSFGQAAASSNPFAVTKNYYVNPSYQAELSSSIATSSGTQKATLESMMNAPSAYWIDVKGKIYGNNTNTVEGILVDAASKSSKQLVLFIIYDLPNRDCHVLTTPSTLYQVISLYRQRLQMEKFAAPITLTELVIMMQQATAVLD